MKSVAANKNTHRLCHKVLSTDDLESMKDWCHVKNTEKKYNSACNAYNEWREDVLDSCSENVNNIALSDITKPHSLEPLKLCNSLCRFIAEVQKVKGGDYPPQSIRDMILSIQMYLHMCRINWKLLSEDDPIFVDLYNIIDNVMKDCTEQDLGKVNSCLPVTNAMEEEMWNTGVLGEHTPAQLLDTILYLIGVNCVWGGEHKLLS